MWRCWPKRVRTGVTVTAQQPQCRGGEVVETHQGRSMDSSLLLWGYGLWSVVVAMVNTASFEAVIVLGVRAAENNTSSSSLAVLEARLFSADRTTSSVATG